MRKLFFFLIIGFLACSHAAFAQENVYSDELMQLKNLNNSLNKQLSVATQEITKMQTESSNFKISNEIVQELAKAKRDLANQSCEIKMLREKMMISKDSALNGL